MIATATILEGHVLDVLAGMDAESVHSCITSPPFWGLRNYNTPEQDWPGGWRGHLGLEPTIDGFVDNLVAVFEAVRRVLRDDGLLFCNLGDSYAGAGHGPDAKASSPNGWDGSGRPNKPTDGLKPLDLCNVPHRFALRMQAEGWYLRSTIIWAKGVSFCDSYSGSVMPESLSGTRWERCRVKTKAGNYPRMEADDAVFPYTATGDACRENMAEWSPCPGCPKCNPNDGLVLRRGSWRPTSAYEIIFMFAKSSNYWCDGEGVRESSGDNTHSRGTKRNPPIDNAGIGHDRWVSYMNNDDGITHRNLRNVWLINPQSFADAHFATYPEALVEPLIKCSTSDKGVCPECGAQWARVVEVGDAAPQVDRPNAKPCGAVSPDGVVQAGMGWRTGQPTPNYQRPSSTLGWRATCTCEDHTMGMVVPATVLDPFLGSGTTLLTARKLGRNGIGIELNPEYAQMARKRLGEYAPLFSGNPTK